MTRERLARETEIALQPPTAQVAGHSVDRSAGPRLILDCPRCGLTMRPRARWLAVDHCPRCLARSRVAVRLYVSTLPAAEPYPAGPSPAGVRASLDHGRNTPVGR